ncbi:MAG: hypothetical protein AAB554_02295 [Patescibacteria group bacterium]
MSERTNEDIIRIVTKYQRFGMVHELTCTIDSRHEALEPVERDGKVILECPTCGTTQEHIPSFVLTSEELLDYSTLKMAEALEEADRRQTRQDVWMIFAASGISAGLLGSLLSGTIGGFGGIVFGGIVAWFATRSKRASISRP